MVFHIEYELCLIAYVDQQQCYTSLWNEIGKNFRNAEINSKSQKIPEILLQEKELQTNYDTESTWIRYCQTFNIN